MRLYNNKGKVFPEYIKIDGEAVAINADFRNILRIFAMMKEKDNKIPAVRKISKLRDWFLMGAARAEPLPYDLIIQVFCQFINPEKGVNQGQNGDNPEKLEARGERQFCYEFDAEEIYAGFLSEYNIDLIECGFLHWYKFKIMLENLSEASAFKKKIALRFLDLSRISREEPGFSDILNARESVQLPYDYSEQEMLEMSEFEKFWDRVN